MGNRSLLIRFSHIHIESTSVAGANSVDMQTIHVFISGSPTQISLANLRISRNTWKTILRMETDIVSSPLLYHSADYQAMKPIAFLVNISLVFWFISSGRW